MTIESYGQLEDFLKIKFKKSISVRLPYFTDIENQRLEHKWNALINECGCQHGSYFLAIGMLIYVTTIFNFSISLLDHIFCVIGILFFSVTGKLIGLGIAKFKLKSEVAKTIKIAQERLAGCIA